MGRLTCLPRTITGTLTRSWAAAHANKKWLKQTHEVLLRVRVVRVQCAARQSSRGLVGAPGAALTSLASLCCECLPFVMATHVFAVGTFTFEAKKPTHVRVPISSFPGVPWAER